MKILTLKQTGSGQWTYEINDEHGVVVGLQYGTYLASTTLEQARGRFRFDKVEGVTIEHVTLTVREEDEIYYGEPTGKKCWKAEVKQGRVYSRGGSVLGRGYSATEAVRDWNYRAAGDGLLMVGTVEALEPPTVWSVVDVEGGGYDVTGPHTAGSRPAGFVGDYDTQAEAEDAAAWYTQQEASRKEADAFTAAIAAQEASGKTYRRVTKEIANPKRDKRAKYGEAACGPFKVGECVQVIAADPEDRFSYGQVYRAQRNSWALRELPPIEEWTEPTVPTDFEWYILDACGGAEWVLLHALIKSGKVTRADIEAIQTEEGGAE